MTSFEYQNKIISLFDELIDNLKNLSNILTTILDEESNRIALNEALLTEKEIKDLYSEFNIASKNTEVLFNALNKAFTDNTSLTDPETISFKIKELVKHCRRIKEDYSSAEELGILTPGNIKDKNAMTFNLEKLSDKIIAYNQVFSPALITIKKAIDATKLQEAKILEELYEEIFHEKMPKNKE